MATVTGGGATTFINAGSNDANGVAQILANQVSAGLQNGSLTRTTGNNPPTGSGVLTISTPGASVNDQPAVQVNLVNAGGNSVGTTSVAIGGSGGQNQVLIGDNSNITFFTGGGSGYAVVGDGNDLIGTPTSGGGSFTIYAGNGNDTVALFSGRNTVFGGTGSNLVYTGRGNNVVASKGTDTITGVGGASGAGDTVFGGSNSILIGEFAKSLTFVGGTGTATVVGGTGGSYVINAGAGGGIFQGGSAGGNLIATGTGSVASTVFGGGNGDLVLVRGSANNAIVASSGNETLQGGTATGNNIYYAKGGNTLMFGGSGADTFIISGGNATVAGGAGAANELVAVQKGGGGSISIYNFASAEKVTLQGYGSTEVANAVAGQQNVGGSATLHLSDNTTITFVNVASVNNTNFV